MVCQGLPLHHAMEIAESDSEQLVPTLKDFLKKIEVEAHLSEEVTDGKDCSDRCCGLMNQSINWMT